MAALCLGAGGRALLLDRVLSNVKIEPPRLSAWCASPASAGGATATCHNASSPTSLAVAVAAVSRVGKDVAGTSSLVFAISLEAGRTQLAGPSHEAVIGLLNTLSELDEAPLDPRVVFVFVEAFPVATVFASSKLVAFAFVDSFAAKKLTLWQASPSKGKWHEQMPSMQVPWPWQLFSHCNLLISQREPAQPSWHAHFESASPAHDP